MLGEIPVICQQQQTFALDVEAPDVKKARKLGREQIKDGIRGVRIASGADETRRLVQGQVNSALRRNELAVNFNVIGGPWLVMKVSASPAVYGDTTFGDEFVRLPPRSDSSSRKKPIQPHRRIWPGNWRLNVRLCLRKAKDFARFFPLASFLEQIDALKTF